MTQEIGVAATGLGTSPLRDDHRAILDLGAGATNYYVFGKAQERTELAR